MDGRSIRVGVIVALTWTVVCGVGLYWEAAHVQAEEGPQLPALHQAAKDGDVARVKALLKAKADPDEKAAGDRTSLHFAVESGGRPECQGR